jgi:ribosomal-protein-alanine N-acetyltransferase
MTLLSGDQTIETERLVLRRITRDDMPFYARIHADPDVARYLAHGNPRSRAETSDWLDAIVDSYRALELGQIAITRKSDGALVGRTGVSHLETERHARPDGTRLGYYFPHPAPAGADVITQAELGYTLDRAAWGNGYAREAVSGVWSYLRAKRPDLFVVSLIHPENARSIRLATTFGATIVDRITSWERPYDRYVWPTGNKPSIDR